MDKLQNVVDLAAYKNLKDHKKSSECFQKYLKSLDQGQLETEVTYLMDHEKGKDFFSKSQLIMRELSSRATGSVKNKIEKMTLNLVTE